MIRKAFNYNDINNNGYENRAYSPVWKLSRKKDKNYSKEKQTTRDYAIKMFKWTGAIIC